MSEDTIISLNKMASCDNQDYLNKIFRFNDNIRAFQKGSYYSNEITINDNLKFIEYFKNDNVKVVGLPIFRYNGLTMNFNDSNVENNNGEWYYLLLTADEINYFIDDKHIVFIYTFLDIQYHNDDMKYRVVILNK